MHPNHVEILPEFSSDPGKPPALLKTLSTVEMKAGLVARRYRGQNRVYPHGPGGPDQKFQKGRAQAPARMIRQDKIGYLCSPPEGFRRMIRSQEGKTHHLVKTLFGDKRRITPGDFQKPVEKAIVYRHFQESCVAVGDVVVEEIDHRLAVFFSQGFEMIFHVTETLVGINSGGRRPNIL